jgi:hypothetical protein
MNALGKVTLSVPDKQAELQSRREAKEEFGQRFVAGGLLELRLRCRQEYSGNSQAD